MEKTISAADANRTFSRMLRDVIQGRSYVVTNHGEPVARISPAEERVTASARESLLARLRKQTVKKVVKWNRDDLYEDTQ